MTQFLAELELATRVLYIPHESYSVSFCSHNSCNYLFTLKTEVFQSRSPCPCTSHEIYWTCTVPLPAKLNTWDAVSIRNSSTPAVGGSPNDCWKIEYNGGCRMVKWLIWNISESAGKFFTLWNKKRKQAGNQKVIWKGSMQYLTLRLNDSWWCFSMNVLFPQLLLLVLPLSWGCSLLSRDQRVYNVEILI